MISRRRLSELYLWSLPLYLFSFQPFDFGKPCLLFALPRKARLLFSQLSLLLLPYTFAGSQPLESLLRLTQLLLSPLSFFDHAGVSLFQLQSANGHETFVKVLVLYAVDARIGWRSDLEAMFEL